MSQIAVAAPANDAAAPGHGDVTVGATGMWTFLAMDAMGFGGLLIAYAILRVRSESWPDPRARLALAPAAAMTFALLLSSLTMTLATRASVLRTRRVWLLATLALGVAFLAGAAIEVRDLLGAAAPMRLTTDLYASTFYLVTGFHGLHVLAGALGIWFMLRAKVSAQVVEIMGLYWHFVDAAWMPIFSLMYLWPAR